MTLDRSRLGTRRGDRGPLSAVAAAAGHALPYAFTRPASGVYVEQLHCAFTVASMSRPSSAPGSASSTRHAVAAHAFVWEGLERAAAGRARAQSSCRWYATTGAGCRRAEQDERLEALLAGRPGARASTWRRRR